MATDRLMRFCGGVCLFAALLVLISAAAPRLFTPWSAFRGTNGITVATNLSTEKVIIDGAVAQAQAVANDTFTSNFLRGLIPAATPQTPLASDINGAGFSETNLFKLALGTAADAGNQNPSIVMRGTNSAGQVVLFRVRTTNSLWALDSSVNGAAYVNDATISSSGALTVPNTVAAGSTFIGINQVTTTAAGQFTWSGSSGFAAPFNGSLWLYNAAINDWYSIFLGARGATNGQIRFVSSTTLNPQFELRSGDTNSYGNLAVGSVFLNGTNTIGAPGMQGPLMGAQLFSDGTNLIAVFQNSAGTRTTNKSSLTAWTPWP